MEFSPLPEAPPVSSLDDETIQIPSFALAKKFADECVAYMRDLMESSSDNKTYASSLPSAENLETAREINNQAQRLTGRYATAYLRVAEVSNSMMSALLVIVTGEQTPTRDLVDKYRIASEALTQLLGAERFMSGVILRLEEATYEIRSDMLTVSQLTAAVYVGNVAIHLLQNEDVKTESPESPEA